MPDKKYANRSGFLVACEATTTLGDTSGVAHLFGRMGQGDKSSLVIPDPFYWGKSEESNKPGMMINVFPSADADTGLASGKEIRF